MFERVENILKMAEEKNTAAIAFICMDYIMARSVVYAAEATNTPAIVMLYPEHASVQYTCNLSGYAAMVKELASEVRVPVGLHLDHDFTYDSIMDAVGKGFGSVMMDGSIHDLETNISMTRTVVAKAHELGVVVEGEIGHVGIAADADHCREDLFTKPDVAERFCRESGVDSLAVSIGNAHGEYKETPHLNLKRLEEIKSVVKVPLVLHGGSGIPDDQLMDAFSKGIRKFNLGTEFLRRYYDAMRNFVEDYNNDPEPVKIIDYPEYAQERLQPYVEERMRTLCRF